MIPSNTPPGNSPGQKSRLAAARRVIVDATAGFRKPKSLVYSQGYLIFVGIVFATVLCLRFGDIAFEKIDEPLESVPLVISLSHLATTVGTFPGGAVLALIVIVLGRKRWKRLALTIGAGLVVQTTVTELIKDLTGRPRPAQIDNMVVFFGPGHSAFNSFPSGHASFAFMLATVVSAYFPRWRWLAYAGAALIALARVMLDRHFLSDVMFGGIIGYLSAYLFLRCWPPQPALSPAVSASSSEVPAATPPD